MFFNLDKTIHFDVFVQMRGRGFLPNAIVIVVWTALFASLARATFTCVSGATNQTVCESCYSDDVTSTCCPADQICKCEGSTRTRFTIVCRDPPEETDETLLAIGIALIVPGAIVMLACFPCLLLFVVMAVSLLVITAPCCGIGALIPTVLCLPCVAGFGSFIAGIVLISLATPSES